MPANWAYLMGLVECAGILQDSFGWGGLCQESICGKFQTVRVRMYSIPAVLYPAEEDRFGKLQVYHRKDVSHGKLQSRRIGWQFDS